jgi:hypothetical protein
MAVRHRLETMRPIAMQLTTLEPDLAPIVILAARAENTLALADYVFKQDTAISELDQLTVSLVYAPFQSRQHAMLSTAIAQHFRRESQTAITTTPIKGP